MSSAPNTIHVILDGNVQGPFSQEQILEMVGQGQLLGETPAWKEGLADWKRLDQLVSLQSMPPVPVAASKSIAAAASQMQPMARPGPANLTQHNNGEIIQIAQSQKSLVRVVVTVFAFNILGASIGFHHLAPLAPVLIPAIMGACGFFTYRMERAMKSSGSHAWIAAIFAALLSLTCVGLAIMALVSSRATKLLKSRGLNVGFMGVSQQDLDNWQTANPPN
jgi:GYF domain 2